MKSQLRFMVKTISSLLLLAVVQPLIAAQPVNTVTNTNAKTNVVTTGRQVTPPSVITPSAVRSTPSGTNVGARIVSGTNVTGTVSVPPAPAPKLNVPPSPAPAVPTIPAVPPTVPPVAAAPVKTSKPEKAEEMVPLINFDNMPLAQVLDFYSELVGRTILRASSLPITTFINLKSRGPLTKSEAITALETVMAMNGITVVPIGDKFMKILQEGTAGQAGGEFNKADHNDLPDSGKFVTQIVQLKSLPAQDAIGAIQAFAKTAGAIIPIPGTQTLVLRDYSENVKRMMEMIEKIDVVGELVIKPEVIPIKYALAGDIAQVLGSLTSSGPGLSVGRNSRGGLSSTGTGSTLGGSTTGTYPGQQNPNPNPTGATGSPSSSRSSFQNRLSQIVNRAASAGDFQILGEAKIIADERTNSLLIFANQQDMIMIKTIIDQLDVVLAQVLIEAIIMEVSLGDEKKVGVSYIQQPKKLGGNVSGAGGVLNGQQFLNPLVGSLLAGSTNTGPIVPSGLPGGFSYFTTIGDSFSVALAATASDSRVNVLSRPRIQTSHAVEATLFIGDTIPYVTGTYFGGVNGQASSQYQQKEVGIKLNVLPLINPDGLVVMDISQSIEAIGDFVTIDNNQVPRTTKREATAKVAVRDRETIILGGFITTEKRKSTSGIPYLKDIPYLGAAFRSKNDGPNRRVELMVFLRPTVLPTPETAAVLATEERGNLPGLKIGEFEAREEERRRNEQVDAEMRKRLGLKDPKKKGN